MSKNIFKVVKKYDWRTVQRHWPSVLYNLLSVAEVATISVLYKKAVLTNFTIFTGKNLCWSFFFKKETPTHVLSCEYYEIFKNTYFEEHLRMAAFRVGFIYVGNLIQIQCPLTDFIRCTAVKNLSKKKKNKEKQVPRNLKITLKMNLLFYLRFTKT